MKISLKSQRKKFKNSGHCTAYEYPLDDPDINGAVITLNGRYPENGCAVNEISKEMAYVIKGSGRVAIENKEFPINEGDIILIDPGEKYFWQGNMELFMPCTPAWSPNQHKIVK
jgi:mannose-6-phosphate isomerase-like protein (cupin superfamily)